MMPAEDSAFAVEVRRFLRDQWPVPPFLPPRQAAVDRWFAALCRRGWSVPAWPQAHGGTGWSLEQRFIWERALALAQAPAMDPVGVGLVGPLVQAHGSAALAALYLDDIRAARSRWAAGLSGLSMDEAGLRAQPNGARHRLHGTLTGIVGLGRATHALCLAAMDGGCSGLFAVALEVAGVGRVDAQTLAFAGAPADLLSPPGSGLDALDAALCGEQAPLAVTAGAEAQLARLKADLPAIADGGGGSLDGDAGFRRRLAHLEVRLASLQALEARCLADRSAGQGRPGAPGAKASLLALGSADLELTLGRLRIDAAGYYALPQPDAVLTDNEGPIGPGYASPPVEGMLTPLWALDAHRRRLTARLMG
ncbi:MAG: acyl-CoA dehydrogenase family protein [Gammaproteobacteria bacterium]|nr:acyl-CoA dehydrogenase family protein [Gammaproteobacteria bacterium]